METNSMDRYAGFTDAARAQIFTLLQQRDSAVERAGAVCVIRAQAIALGKVTNGVDELSSFDFGGSTGEERKVKTTAFNLLEAVKCQMADELLELLESFEVDQILGGIQRHFADLADGFSKELGDEG